MTAGEALSREAGYAQTTPIDDTFQVVYALDCEMCYTTAGLELTRVSVIDMNCKPVYEKLIKPSHTIVDYNTRYRIYCKTNGTSQQQPAKLGSKKFGLSIDRKNLFSFFQEACLVAFGLFGCLYLYLYIAL